MFEGVKMPRDLQEYTLMNGVTDFTNLKQWNLYESGYSFLKVIAGPKFVNTLAQMDKNVEKLYLNFKHVLEYEFRGIDGLEDTTVDTLELTNGISSLNMISKVNQQSASTVSMRFFEKSGSLITKFADFYLKGIKDPRTQAKTYYGLIESGVIPEGGYENEVFHLLYYVTDNTTFGLEKAYLLANCQLTKAEDSIYNSEKGTIENKEVTVEFNCFPIQGDLVNQKAKAMLEWDHSTLNGSRIILDSGAFAYQAVGEIDAQLARLGAIKKS